MSTVKKFKTNRVFLRLNLFHRIVSRGQFHQHFRRTDLHRSYKRKFYDFEIWCQFHQRSTYSFCACRSQKRKKILLSHKYLFTLSGSASVKAVRRTLMKSSPALIKAAHKHVGKIDPRSSGIS